MLRALLSHQWVLGSNPGIDAICQLTLFVVGSLLCSERFLSEYSACLLVPSPQKLKLPKSNSIWNAQSCLNEFLRTPKCFTGKQITKKIYSAFTSIEGGAVSQ